MIEQVVDRRRRDAVDAQPPGDRTFRPSLRAGADIGLAIHAFDGGEDREAGLRAIAHDIGIGRTAETTPGERKETASIRLVLPEPLSPVSTT